MKRIAFSRKFVKAYSKRIVRNVKLRDAYAERYSLFADGERGYPLDDHPLTGNMIGKRSFSVTGDIRVIYEETEDHIIFTDIGSHNQVYK